MVLYCEEKCEVAESELVGLGVEARRMRGLPRNWTTQMWGGLERAEDPPGFVTVGAVVVSKWDEIK
jgi:hypothetical protein